MTETTPNSTDNGQFLLPYEAVRTAANPDRTFWSFSTAPIVRPLNAASGTEPRSKSIRAGGMRNSEHQLDRGNHDQRPTRPEQACPDAFPDRARRGSFTRFLRRNPRLGSC